ncbi:MAG TPA: malate synthase A [Candidatus Thermoplasmatota archaeon]|nr:malate synthase A [Candidatus Thermoplasmatota archaeon]
MHGTVIRGAPTPRSAQVLTPDAIAFLSELHRRFEPTRQALLRARELRQRDLDAGRLPDFLPETRAVREDVTWRVAPVHADLQDRRVEITGPTDRKMVVNALNSGARCFMADFEDANSPTWENCVEGQANLIAAHERAIDFVSPEGKAYKLNDRIATLLVRPRGWHLVEKHVHVDGAPMSASLFDFGLYFFHNARFGKPYFYLPKMESHLEARLWNDVFVFAQAKLGVPRGTIKATVLVETLLAAFEMDEILYELREHSAGLNAGRWDYIFSAIKKLHARRDIVFPDRGQITMGVPFMRAYCELLVKTCHKRGAHAMGGMSAFIPNRKDPAVTEAALAKVREDKVREVTIGFDGTWVAHPDLVPVAMAEFDRALGTKPNQVSKPLPEGDVSAKQLLDFHIPGATPTEAGLRANVDVALQYLGHWLNGTGAVAIHNLMEDAATAEISRSQVWQWVARGVFPRERVEAILAEEAARLRTQGIPRIDEAADILRTISFPPHFTDFLTIPAYERL